MDAVAYWLPVVWAAIIGIAVALYVILDGFDLGLGILFPFTPEEGRRDVMMNSVAPFWDGNETWLVLGGGELLVAFPLAYAVIMPALYLPIIIMLLGLIFRGVAFEFRWTAKPSHEFWDNAFAYGSIVATFMQGVVLGGYVQGINVQNNQFAGGTFDWFAPFPLFTGVALIVGYALLGTTWLVMKTEGELAVNARRWAQHLLIAVLVIMVIISLWTPLAFDRIADRWFTWPNILYLSPVPLLTAGAAFACWYGLRVRARRDAISVGRRAVPAWLHRTGHFHGALPGATDADLLGCGGGSQLADLHARRHAHHAADDPRLHGVRLLDIPRKGARRRRLPLSLRM